MPKLTEKQAAFVAAKLAGLKNEEAAIHAGYSLRGAKQQATSLMRHPDVAAAIRKGRRTGTMPPNVVKHAGEKSIAEQIAADVAADPDRRLKDRYESPLELFLDVMNNAKFPDGTRIGCAKEALPYCHGRVGEKGKKEQKKDAAAEVGKGKFGRKPPPAITPVSRH